MIGAEQSLAGFERLLSERDGFSELALPVEFQYLFIEPLGITERLLAEKRRRHKDPSQETAKDQNREEQVCNVASLVSHYSPAFGATRLAPNSIPLKADIRGRKPVVPPPPNCHL